jgi:peptidoglycan/xylan/chitin deacetylase (PgdA/CDA1 family)
LTNLAPSQRIAHLAAVLGLFVGGAGSLPAQQPVALPAAVRLTAEQDHQRMLDLLGIASLRRGPDGDPKSPNAANVDESKVPPYHLPDPLVRNDGKPVTTPEAWWHERRPQIVEAFDREILGRIPQSIPAVDWEVASSTKETAGDYAAVTKTLVGHVDNSAYPQIKVDIQLSLTVPAKAQGPVPVVMLFDLSPEAREAIKKRMADARIVWPADPPPPWQQQVLARGWGYATLIATSIQADNGEGLTEGIIGLVNKGQPRKLDDWGALRAWAWGASCALDYFESDNSVDAKRVAIAGLSRYGKAALITMAYDPRFSVAFVGSSGEGGAKILRRKFGEQVENLASTSEYHWMAGNFLKYAGPLTPNDLPVDSPELIALCAPRPVFISAGSPQVEGGWIDAKGMFLGGVGAGPVYKLLGRKDLGTSEFPAVGQPVVSGDIAFLMHSGGHTLGPNWPALLDFAARYWNAPRSTGSPEVALTFDDLPAHGPLPGGLTRVDIINSIIQSLKAAHAPEVYGFMNTERTEGDSRDPEVLELWRDAGFPLGNHTYSHMNLDQHSVEEFEKNILDNEPMLQKFANGTDWHWFRYPYLHEGDTREKHDAIVAFLKEHGYKVAEVTLSFGDYAYNEPYARCIAKNDTDGIEQLKKSYMDGAADSLVLGRRLAHQLYNRDVKYILLLHVGGFQTVMLPKLLELLRQQNFKLVTLPDAAADPAYAEKPILSGSYDELFFQQVLRARHISPSDQSEGGLDKLDAICR